MLKKLVIILAIVVSVQARETVSTLLNELHHLTWQQTQILAKTKYKGDEFNLGYSLCAIAWKESDFGKWKINLMDPSCGIFHAMPKFMTDNKWNQSRLCERLITDYDFSFSTALQQLKYWENYWRSKHVHRVWSHTICSYNTGYRFNPESSYLQSIKLRVRALQLYFKQKKIK